jgi:hypothetical protein
MTSDVVGKVGHYYEQGDFILEVANASVMEADIIISEKYRNHIAPGQRVVLKIHTQPYQTLETQVERISPAVEKDGQENVAKLYGTLEGHHRDIWPGMSGYARIYLKRRPLGSILFDRVMRFIRTEFWW